MEHMTAIVCLLPYMHLYIVRGCHTVVTLTAYRLGTWSISPGFVWRCVSGVHAWLANLIAEHAAGHSGQRQRG
jgi:hypothetical protein